MNKAIKFVMAAGAIWGGAVLSPAYADWVLNDSVLSDPDTGWAFTVDNYSRTVGETTYTGLRITGLSASPSDKTQAVDFRNKPMPEGKPLLAIGSGSACMAGVVSLCLPDTLLEVGSNAFNGNTTISSIEPFLPDSVVSIQPRAFGSTSNLKIPLTLKLSCDRFYDDDYNYQYSPFYQSGITAVDMSGSAITAIPGRTFMRCRSMVSAKLPENLEDFGFAVFYECTSLESVTPFLPATLTHFGVGVFSGDSKLSGDVVLSNPELVLDAVTTDQDGHFYNVAGIVSADLSATRVTETPRAFFKGCTKLVSVKYPETLMTIGDGSHYPDSNLADVQFQSFPCNFQDQLVDTPGNYTGRIVYPMGDAQWAKYIETQRQNDNFIAWEDCGNNTNTYYANFADGWTPIGYSPVVQPVVGGHRAVGKWLVPYRAVVTDCRLAVGGTPLELGEPTPAYGSVGKVSDAVDFSVANRYDVRADDVFECLGYKMGEVNADDGTVTYGDTVANLSGSFDPTGRIGSYIINWQWARCAYRLTVAGNSAFPGTVAISEGPFQNIDGFYPVGSQITLTATPAEGAEFVRWYGDVPTGHERDNPLTLTADMPRSVVPYFSGKWVCDENLTSVSDGYWTFPVSGTREALVLGVPATEGLVPILDLTKGIEGGGAFVAVADDWLGRGAKSANLEEVWFADTILELSVCCLYNSPRLKSVTLSARLERIGDSAVRNCPMLTSVTPFLPDSVTYIESAAFKDTANLKIPLTLSARCARIHEGDYPYPYGAFQNCGVTEVDLSGSSITELSGRMFMQCASLVSVRLPEKLETLGAAVFYECRSLESVTPFLPATLTYLGGGQFSSDAKMTGDLVLNNRKLVVELPTSGQPRDGSFYSTGIVSADLSGIRIAETPLGLFQGCASLVCVKYPKTLETLGDGCHYNARKLADIQYRSFPAAFWDQLVETPGNYTGRIVYPKGDAGWEAYIAEQQAAGNFIAWEDCGDKTNTYYAAFADGWKPLGYFPIVQPVVGGYSAVGKWLVPHNFNVGMAVLVR